LKVGRIFELGFRIGLYRYRIFCRRWKNWAQLLKRTFHEDSYIQKYHLAFLLYHIEFVMIYVGFLGFSLSRNQREELMLSVRFSQEFCSRTFQSHSFLFTKLFPLLFSWEVVQILEGLEGMDTIFRIFLSVNWSLSLIK